jgi:hypothetical protein
MKISAGFKINHNSYHSDGTCLETRDEDGSITSICVSESTQTIPEHALYTGTSQLSHHGKGFFNNTFPPKNGFIFNGVIR